MEDHSHIQYFDKTPEQKKDTHKTLLISWVFMMIGMFALIELDKRGLMPKKSKKEYSVVLPTIFKDYNHIDGRSCTDYFIIDICSKNK